MEDLVEPTLLQVKEEEELELMQIKEEEEEMVQIKEEEEEMVQMKEEEEEMVQIKEEEQAREIKEEEEELGIKQEESDDEGSGSSRDLICNERAEAAGHPVPANQTSAGPNWPAAAGGQTGTSAPLGTFRSVEKRQRARTLHRRLSLVDGLISESLLLLEKTPGRRSVLRRNAVRHQTKATLLLHATRILLHSVSSDLKVISRDSSDSPC